ncbi:hypothetical protein QBC41DRAFT_335225 [Cercophora samala]|uniref:Uncharacterized protein n=1 Tax=Cercophora samala TaxID=330535 RepID=A0AA39ZI31_9PEZI|nr:hypothetical protein QBC41DRAFT_335225 [Cercophora samala]
MAPADPSTNLDLCSICPGLGRSSQVFVKANDDDLRQFFEDRSFFPQGYQGNEVILNNLTLLFKAFHWFIELLGTKRHGKAVATALGYPRLFAKFNSIFDRFLANRKQYLANKEGPRFPAAATSTQRYLLEIIDDTLKFGKIGSTLGANYRLADCKERWQDFLKELKETGDITLRDSDSDSRPGSEEDSDSNSDAASSGSGAPSPESVALSSDGPGSGLGADSSLVDVNSAPDDPASGTDAGPGPGPGPETPETSKATSARSLPGAGLIAFANGAAANLPVMLRLLADLQKTGEELPGVVANFRDCCVALEHWSRREILAQVQDTVVSRGSGGSVEEDSDHDSLFVTPLERREYG